MANVDLPPICHASIRPGPPSDQAQVATTFIRQVLDNAKLVDLRDLCVREGRFCWAVHVDVICLNHDGNILDASLKAVVAAFRSVPRPIRSSSAFKALIAGTSACPRSR